MSTLLTSLSSKAEPLFQIHKKLRRVRRGNKVSRVFRLIFEQRRTKHILGGNLAVLVLVSSLLPQTTRANFEQNGEIIYGESELNIKTEQAVKFPVDEVKINQGFSLFHPGVDFEGITGDPVRAILKGRVSEVQFSKYAYGNAVLVAHGDGLESLYAHLSKIEVNKGEIVYTQTKLGEIGATGRASGDHLHLEIRENGRQINPMTILPSLSQQ